MNSIKIDQLDKEIRKLLDAYGDEINEDLEKVTKKLATQAKKEVQNNAPVDQGNYQKSISLKATKESANEKAYTVYAKAPHYRLTHLLENGHAIAGGTGRTQPQKHWGKAQDYIEKNFEEMLRLEIEKNG